MFTLRHCLKDFTEHVLHHLLCFQINEKFNLSIAFVASDIAIFVLKGDIKLQLAN